VRLDDEDRAVPVPLILATGVEKEAVVACCVRRLAAFDKLMESANLLPLGHSAPEP
jgi:hypothetical protein